MNYDGSTAQQGNGFQVHAAASRGRVWLNCSDPEELPKILLNYMSTEKDCQEMKDNVRLTQEIISQKAFEGLGGLELLPGPKVETNMEINVFFHEYGACAYHPSCTWTMGVGSFSVVDNKRGVHGTGRLGTVRSSTMPLTISGHLNEHIIMVG